MNPEPRAPANPSIERQSRPETARAVSRLWTTMWGQANALVLGRRRIALWADLVILAAGAALLWGLVRVGREWTGIHRPAVQIDLSPLALPMYTLYSLARGL